MATKKTRGRTPQMHRARKNGRSALKRSGTTRRSSLLRDAERTAGDIGHWVETRAGTVNTTMRKPVMLGALSVAAAGLLGWYLARRAD